MKTPRINFSDAAIADILEQADWYEAQADRNLAQRWQEAVTATLLRIARRPGTGSRCTFTLDVFRVRSHRDGVRCAKEGAHVHAGLVTMPRRRKLAGKSERSLGLSRNAHAGRHRL